MGSFTVITKVEERGGHCIDDCQENKDLDSDHVRQTDASFKDCSLGTSGCQLPVEINPCDPTDTSQLGNRAEGTGHLNTDFVLKGNCPRIMFMNIADDAKKTCLTKVLCVSYLYTSLSICLNAFSLF